MPPKTIKFYVQPRQVSAALLRISQVEGVDARLLTQKLAEPDANKEHGAYSLDFAQLTPILISVTGTLSSLVALAAAILNYKAAQAKTNNSIENSQAPAPIIQINNNIISLSEFSDAEKLASHLNATLEDK